MTSTLYTQELERQRPIIEVALGGKFGDTLDSLSSAQLDAAAVELRRALGLVEGRLAHMVRKTNSASPLVRVDFSPTSREQFEITG